MWGSLGSAREVCPCSQDSATIRIKVGIRPRTAVGFGSRPAYRGLAGDVLEGMKEYIDDGYNGALLGRPASVDTQLT
jgi:hypothetical protein